MSSIDTRSSSTLYNFYQGLRKDHELSIIKIGLCLTEFYLIVMTCQIRQYLMIFIEYTIVPIDKKIH